MFDISIYINGQIETAGFPVQVGDFLRDQATVGEETSALATICSKTVWSGASGQGLQLALLELPKEHQLTIFQKLLGLTSINRLLPTVPFMLQQPLLLAALTGMKSNSEASGEDVWALLLPVLADDTLPASKGAVTQPLSAAARGALCMHLQMVPPLVEVDVSGHNMGDDGTAALLAALQPHTQLEALHIAGNGMGDVGANALRAALLRLPHLRSLDISGNFAALDESKANILASVLPTLKQLKRFVGDVQGSVATALPAHVGACTALQHLHLPQCVGTSDMLEALRHLTHLVLQGFYGLPHVLRQSLERVTGLQELCVNGNRNRTVMDALPCVSWPDMKRLELQGASMRALYPAD